MSLVLKPSAQIIKRKQTIQRLRPKIPAIDSKNSPVKRPQTTAKIRDVKAVNDNEYFIRKIKN